MIRKSTPKEPDTLPTTVINAPSKQAGTAFAAEAEANPDDLGFVSARDGKFHHVPDDEGRELPDAFASAASELVAEARAASEVMTREELAETLQVNQLIGITSYARVLDSVNKVTMLKALQRIKDSKGYKTMALPGPDGTVIKPKNWAGLCDALGLSRSKVDEDLQNLSIFGEHMLEAQDSLGIGYRDLRLLRAGLTELPEGKRQEVKDLIAAAVESGDKEEILATLDEMGVRNAKLSGELAEAKKTLKAKTDLQAKTSEKLQELEVRLERALNPASEDDRQKNISEARTAFMTMLDEECNSLVGVCATLSHHIINVRKSDTEGAPLGEPIIDAALWEHANARVDMMCRTVRGLLLDAGLDVDFAEAFAPDEGWRDPGVDDGEADSSHPQQ